MWTNCYFIHSNQEPRRWPDPDLTEMKKIFFHTATLLTLISSSVTLAAQGKDPVSINWSLLGTLPQPANGQHAGLAGAFIGACGPYLWIAGGANFSNGLPWEGGTKVLHDTVFYFHRNSQQAVLLPQRSRLPFAVAYGTSIRVPNAVACIGGQTATGFSEKAFLAKLSEQTGSLVLEDLPDLPYGLANAAGALAGNRLFVAGGENEKGVASSLLMLDLSADKPAWKTLADLPHAVSHTLLVAQTYRNKTYLYLVGGRRKDVSGISELYATVYRYVIDADKWELCAPLPYPLSAHTGLACGSENIFVLGGDKGVVFGKVERALAAIEKESDPVIKARLIKEKNELQNTHPGFSREILQYDTETDVWNRAGDLPFPTPVTTQAINWGIDIVLPSGEIKAGVRTPDIWIGRIAGQVKKK